MQQLMISKIEVHDNGVKHMECSTLPSDFENHPQVIYHLGDYYYKYDHDTERKIIHYRTRSGTLVSQSLMAKSQR